MLCRIKLSAADLKKYVELCSKKTEPMNKNLAGLIKHEHEINLQKFITSYYVLLRAITCCYIYRRKKVNFLFSSKVM